MWMTTYINTVKRRLVRDHGWTYIPGTKKSELRIQGPDGTFPMKIEGKLDNVKVIDGKLHVGNFAVEKSKPNKANVKKLKKKNLK